MNVNQYLMIQLEILKDITVGDKVAPQVKFEMNLPHGIAWADAEMVCDEFKEALQTMKANQEAALAKQAEEKAAAESQAPVVDAEIVAEAPVESQAPIVEADIVA